jgi:hypothetical protein
MGWKYRKARRKRVPGPKRVKRETVGKCAWCGEGVSLPGVGFCCHAHRIQAERYRLHVINGGGFMVER